MMRGSAEWVRLTLRFDSKFSSQCFEKAALRMGSFLPCCFMPHRVISVSASLTALIRVSL